MFDKNNVSFKATHYYSKKKLYFPSQLKMQLSNIYVKCKTKSVTADSEKNGVSFFDSQLISDN